jgi:hypothetical protein
VLNRIDVSNNPVNYVDWLGLYSDIGDGYMGEFPGQDYYDSSGKYHSGFDNNDYRGSDGDGSCGQGVRRREDEYFWRDRPGWRERLGDRVRTDWDRFINPERYGENQRPEVLFDYAGGAGAVALASVMGYSGLYGLAARNPTAFQGALDFINNTVPGPPALSAGGALGTAAKEVYDYVSELFE